MMLIVHSFCSNLILLCIFIESANFGFILVVMYNIALEYCVPVRHSRLILCQTDQIVMVQNVSMMVILGEKYTTSNNAREKLKLETLHERRNGICLKFGQKALKHPNHTNWFQLNQNYNEKKKITNKQVERNLL